MDLPVFEKFEIKKFLGRKICYSAYEAFDRRNGLNVQLKVLDAELSKNEACVVNFLNGARIIKHLGHINICRIFEFGKDQKGGYFIAGEPAQMETMSALILDEFSLSLEDLIEIFSVIGSTLRNAHLHGLVHGMLNPNSIYVKPDGAIKIDDFGFYWHIPDILKKEDAHSLHLARYVAPDFYQNLEQVDGRADIYSLGLILYEILACQHPIDGKTLSAVQTQHITGGFPEIDMDQMELPGGLWPILDNCIKPNRELRFQNLRELLKALQEIKDKHVVGEIVMPELAQMDLSTTPTETEKYFDDSGVSHYNPEIVGTTAPGNGKKYLLTGIGVLLLVVLVLFVTNYIPLPFGEKSHSGYEAVPEGYSESKAAYSSGEPQANLFPDSNNKQPFRPQPDHKLPDDVLTNSVLMAAEDDDVEQAKPVREPEPQVVRRRKPSVTPPVTERKPLQEEKPPARRATTTETRAVTKPAVQPMRTASLPFMVSSDDEPVIANIFLNNRFVGKTNSQGSLVIDELEVGKGYSIRVAQQGYSSVTRRIEVQDNNLPVRIALESKQAQYGTLLIDAVPRADEVYIDGIHHKGGTPSRVSLKGGKHTIKLVNSNLRTSWEQEVELRIGQVLRVRHDFTKKEMGQVAISLKNAAQYGFGYVYVDGKLWQERHNTTPLEIKLPVGSHTIEVRRDGFASIPKDVIVQVDKEETQYVAFTFTKVNQQQ